MIIHPITNQQYFINSNVGRDVLKNYIQNYKTGGAIQAWWNYIKTRAASFLPSTEESATPPTPPPRRVQLWLENELNVILSDYEITEEELKELYDIQDIYNEKVQNIQNTRREALRASPVSTGRISPASSIIGLPKFSRHSPQFEETAEIEPLETEAIEMSILKEDVIKEIRSKIPELLEDEDTRSFLPIGSSIPIDPDYMIEIGDKITNIQNELKEARISAGIIYNRTAVARDDGDLDAINEMVVANTKITDLETQLKELIKTETELSGF